MRHEQSKGKISLNMNKKKFTGSVLLTLEVKDLFKYGKMKFTGAEFHTRGKQVEGILQYE